MIKEQGEGLADKESTMNGSELEILKILTKTVIGSYGKYCE